MSDVAIPLCPCCRRILLKVSRQKSPHIRHEWPVPRDGKDSAFGRNVLAHDRAQAGGQFVNREGLILDDGLLRLQAGLIFLNRVQVSAKRGERLQRQSDQHEGNSSAPSPPRMRTPLASSVTFHGPVSTPRKCISIQTGWF